VVCLYIGVEILFLFLSADFSKRRKIFGPGYFSLMDNQSYFLPYLNLVWFHANVHLFLSSFCEWLDVFVLRCSSWWLRQDCSYCTLIRLDLKVLTTADATVLTAVFQVYRC